MEGADGGKEVSYEMVFVFRGVFGLGRVLGARQGLQLLRPRRQRFGDGVREGPPSHGRLDPDGELQTGPGNGSDAT